MMTRKDFHHPFQPYDIQQDFMQALYTCIDQGKVGIFESPTGTGKSLSLLCGSLTWLREHKRKTFDDAVAQIRLDNDDDEPDWMTDHAVEMKKHELRQLRADFEARLKAVRDREQSIRERSRTSEPPYKRIKSSHHTQESQIDEEQFVLDDYCSDDERRRIATDTDYSNDTTKLMEKLGMLSKTTEKISNAEVAEDLKIYFCSRTHSQLSQLVGELKRLQIPSSIPPEQDLPAVGIKEDIKHLTLGSRRNLCINSKVNTLPSQSAINERCIELQQPSTPSDRKCSFLPKKESEDLLLDFRDHAIARIRDIEDLATVGSRLQICPYYASRPAISSAEIVTLPYPLLLQKSAREALGISLKNHVVIIDEAHNLADAIEGIYSSRVSNIQLENAKSALITYLQKFRNRLKGSNRTYVTQLIRVIDSLLQYVSTVKNFPGSGDTTKPSDLLTGKAVDQINLSKLVRYLNESKLARKVEGYITSISSSEKGNGRSNRLHEMADIPTLSHIENFLIALTNPAKEGRFFWAKEKDGILLQYLLLDPSEHFHEVVQDARAVILAGGTMSPMDDFKDHLFPYLPSLTTFSCGHLIPSSSLFVRTISSDNSGPLELSFRLRNEATATRLGQALLKICPQIIGGLVVFFPSYGYLESVLQSWKRADIQAQLEQNKPFFWDNRNTASEETFEKYSEAVRTKRGAILLSVIGGKLSEGINFSDDLGRCVMVVGLPYPNLETAEWKAKLQYIDDRAMKKGEPNGKASRQHAENVCMRSVNQAIGRAIRHKNDWASILLFDARYNNSRIASKLPGWIRSSHSTEVSGRLADVVSDLRTFFGSKTQKGSLEA